MMKTRQSILALVIAGLALTACSDRQPPQVQYVPAPGSTAPAPGYTWNANTGQWVPPYQPQGGQYAPQYAPQQQPVVVDNSGISGTTALVGAAAVGTAAYLAGKNAGQANAPTTTTSVNPAPRVDAPAAAPVTVTPAKPAAMVATPAAPVAVAAPAAKPFEPVRVHPQPTAAPVAAKPAAAPVQTFKPVAAAPSYSYKPSASTSFKPATVRK
jgi:hypothetical protein